MTIAVLIYDISCAGGTERAAINLCNMLAQEHTIYIVSLITREGNQAFFDLNPSVRVVHLEAQHLPISKHKKVYWLFYIIKKLREDLKKLKPDIIIGEGHNINCTLPFLKVKKGAKTIACEHIVYKTIPLVSRMMMRIIYPFIDTLVVLSNKAKSEIKQLNRNTVVIPNSLSFDFSKQSALDSKTILMVGRLSDEKGYDRLVPIAKKLKIKHSDWRIKIFGKGRIRQELEDLYKKEGISEFITIHDPVKNIQDEYLKASIFIITSYTEAMPMVIIEAKTCGVPVVGYDCEGTKELINHDVDGFVIRDGDTDEFFNKLHYLIINPQYRKQMGDIGKGASVNYSTHNVSNIWRHLLLSI